ncbi:restriction endonuclease subunit S [uncultured Streptococcus sp.]|uniref:restriction endonuclease subunit S n=1 Tax=uncultured Streptococcus sp. TaxID=83427 RepID=UPI0025E4DF68|nr:restriction endonuclease subunit S [uncultured Streptococcus sp.]MDU1739425.1 restriction endonuclease subunit S [Streptococcus mitis]
MSKLEECILGDLVEFQRGYDLPKSKFVEGKYPVQSSNGILGYHNEYKVEGPGITIGRSGTVGNPHLIRENFFPHNTSLFVKEFKGNDIEYIYYLLQYLDLGNQKSGSGVPTMNRNHLHPIKIRAYRDKTCQQRTIKILSLIDKKIQINNQINQELEAMAKTLYDYWFVQFDFPDQNGKPYKSSGGKMVYHPELKCEIPEGWGVENLFDIADVQYGYPFSTDYFNSIGEGVPVIRIRDILGNDITNYSTEEVEDKYKINVGDVLIGMDGNFHMNYWIKENCYLNQRVVKVNSDKLPNMVLKYQIEPFIKLREKSVSRTTVGHLSDKDLKAINVILPKEKNLSPIVERFESILKNIIINQQQNQELTQLRDWLLPMLMNGQVKV